MKFDKARMENLEFYIDEAMDNLKNLEPLLEAGDDEDEEEIRTEVHELIKNIKRASDEAGWVKDDIDRVFADMIHLNSGAILRKTSNDQWIGYVSEEMREADADIGVTGDREKVALELRKLVGTKPSAGDMLNVFDLGELCVAECSSPGPSDVAVRHWREKIGFEVYVEEAVEYLLRYGAWEEDELREGGSEELAERVLWLACCQIAESGWWYYGE